MNFDYNEEQQLLAASVKRFIDKDYTFEARKKIVASNEGHSNAIWSTFAEIACSACRSRRTSALGGARSI
jgi:hypothetical protein